MELTRRGFLGGAIAVGASLYTAGLARGIPVAQQREMIWFLQSEERYEDFGDRYKATQRHVSDLLGHTREEDWRFQEETDDPPFLTSGAPIPEWIR